MKGDVGSHCLISVHGTDFQVYRQKGSYKFWYGFKFKKRGVRYEVGVSIVNGDIVWINGPFPCGHFNDIKIFRTALKNILENGERVEADDRYVAEAPTYVLCPKAIRSVEVSTEEKKLAQRIRSRQETVNKRFKQFGCLRQIFRHPIEKHACCFRAVAIVTQISMQNGSPLFAI